MSEITLLKELLPEDHPLGDEYQNYKKVEKNIVSTLSENQFTISQTRYLFNNILMQFEREMPVTNHRKY